MLGQSFRTEDGTHLIGLMPERELFPPVDERLKPCLLDECGELFVLKPTLSPFSRAEPGRRADADEMVDAIITGGECHPDASAERVTDDRPRTFVRIEERRQVFYLLTHLGAFDRLMARGAVLQQCRGDESDG